MYILKNNLNYKTMKAITKLLVFSVVLLYTTVISGQEQLTVPLSSPGKSFSLNVSLLNGSINVTTYSGNEITIETKSSSENESAPAEKNGMRRIAKPAGYEIVATENNNEVVINNNNFNSSVNLNIKIPQQDVRLNLTTVNDGDIVVSNAKGEMEINNVNGSIQLENVTGSVVASTISGDVKVNFVSVNPNAAMAFSTLSGDIDLTLPAMINVNLKLKSDMGEMYSDFDLSVEQSNSNPIVTQENGMRKVEKSNWVVAKINKGGPEYLLKNMTGSIYIRKGK